MEQKPLEIADLLKISKLDSYIYWRNRYTTPGKEPFNELGVVTPGECPINCTNQYVDVWAEEPGELVTYRCLCWVLEWIADMTGEFDKYKYLRTIEEPAWLHQLKGHSDLSEGSKSRIIEAKKAATRFITNPHRWLIMQGTYGTGKTHIMRAINRAMWPVFVYISAGDLETLIHECRKNDTLSDLQHDLVTVPALGVDDLGIDYGGPLLKSVIDKTIDARLKQFPNKPVVLATNYGTEGINNYLPRMADRLLSPKISDVFNMKLVDTSGRVFSWRSVV
jgi:DNA replication protein DnaC